MWPVWLRIFYVNNLQKHLRTHCWRNDDEKTDECNQCDYASHYVSNLRAHMQPVWLCIFFALDLKDIFQNTLEKNPENAASVIMNLLRNAIWRFIWQFTVGKSQTNVTNVTMPPLNQAIWRKCTVEKKETNAASVTLHLCGHTPWRNTWKCKLKFDIEIIQAM